MYFRAITKTRLNFTSTTAINARTFGRSAWNITPSSDALQQTEGDLDRGTEKGGDC